MSALGLPDLASKIMRRQKRNVEQDRRNSYPTNPQYEMHQRQQQQKFQQYQPPSQQQELQDNQKFDNQNSNSNSPPHGVPYGSQSEENNPSDHEPVINTPRQMSLRGMGNDKRSNSEEEDTRDSRGPKYEFNYDIPKDSFQSDVINGQFSTFAKLPMSFESLIQSDASFLDSLAEQAPESVDRSVSRNYNNVPSTYSAPSTSQMRDPRNEQVSNLRTNSDDSDYDSEVFEPAQRPPTSQIQNSPHHQYSTQNQQYHGPETPQQPQKLIQLPASQPPMRQPVELPVYVNGGNEQSEGYEYVNLKPQVNQRPSMPPQYIAPPRRAPLKGLIRQASQAFRQPYQGFMERSSSDDSGQNALMPDRRSRFHLLQQRRRFDRNQYPNMVSEQRIKDMMMTYYTTTPPPPPPPQKVVNAQLQVIKNGLPTLPVLPKQLSINYVSGPPPPPPPPKNPYDMYTTTPPPPPPPPPPPRYYDRSRRPPSTYDRMMDQMWDKYTTTPPPPPPPSKVIQFGLNFR